MFRFDRVPRRTRSSASFRREHVTRSCSCWRLGPLSSILEVDAIDVGSMSSVVPVAFVSV
jgi:hypothetical protein